MIRVKRSFVIQKLREQSVSSYTGHNHLVKNALNGEGNQAMAYLVKKGEITFTRSELKSELDDMVENNLLTILQWESMTNLLENASNGEERVANFLRRKRRIQVV